MMRYKEIFLCALLLLLQTTAFAQRDKVARPIRPGVSISYPNQSNAQQTKSHQQPQQPHALAGKKTRIIYQMEKDSIDSEIEDIVVVWDSATYSILIGDDRYEFVLVESSDFGRYLIGKTEVPQWLWNSCSDNRSAWKSNPMLPVDNASAEECELFILFLNKKTGQRFSLPTEQQWEYAARGGSRSNTHPYSGSNNINDVAWSNRNSNSQTHPVGSKQPNELGIHDMSGNVWERCQGNVYRGGGWNSAPERCRIDSRSDSTNNDCYNHIGLRLTLILR